MDRVLAVAEICLSPLLVDIMRKEAWNTWGVTAEWGIVPDSLEVATRTWKVPVQDKRSLRQIPNWTSFIGRSELPYPTEHACSAPQLRSVQLALSGSWASSFGNRHNNCVAHTSESTNRWLQTYWNVQISRQLRTPLMWLILENYLSWEKIAHVSSLLLSLFRLNNSSSNLFIGQIQTQLQSWNFSAWESESVWIQI